MSVAYPVQQLMHLRFVIRMANFHGYVNLIVLLIESYRNCLAGKNSVDKIHFADRIHFGQRHLDSLVEPIEQGHL